MAFQNTTEKHLSFYQTSYLSLANSINLCKSYKMRHTLLHVLIVLLFANCAKHSKKDDSILQFVPKNASIVIKINDFQSLQEEIVSNEILKELENTTAYTKVATKIEPLNFLKEQKKGILVLSSKDSIQLDFIYITKDSLSFLDWKDFEPKKIETKTTLSSTITSYEIDELSFYTVNIGSYSMLSSSQTLIQSIITEDDSESHNPSLIEFFEISNPNKNLNIYIDFEKGQQLLSQLIGDDQKLNNFAEWTSLDISLNETEILLTGISIPDSSSNQTMNLLSPIKPMDNSLTSITPNGSDFIKSYTFDNFGTFTRKYREFNTELPKDSILNTIEEIGWTTIDDDPLLFLKTYGTASLTDYINSSKVSTEDYGGSEIWQMNDSLPIFKILYPFIGKANFTYGSIIENTFIFGASKKAVETTLTSYKTGNVFEKKQLFNSAKGNLTDNANMLTIADFKGATDLIENSISKNFAQEISNTKLNDFAFGSQAIADDGFFHSLFFIKKITKAIEKNSVTEQFEVSLKNDLATNPQFVVNHNSRKQEILVQDQDNILYLISNKGNILWEKQLEGTIQGEIHQVDLYKNEKLQYAFTTNNEFLILDRNGKEVEPFTMKFEGGNLNPLAVFDYDDDKDYRFLVTQNKNVFMYNNKGRLVKGFNYTTAESAIIKQPQHFRINKKDYLLFALENNTLKILNRVGNNRINVNEKFTISDNLLTDYQNKFTSTTEDGKLIQIDTNGKISKINLNLTADHGMDATSRTLAIMNDNILRIRDKKVELELGVYSKPTIFYLNDKIYVSVTDIQNQKIYLYDSQAEPIPNFPIYGNSIVDMADMDNDKSPELVFKD